MRNAMRYSKITLLQSGVFGKKASIKCPTAF